MAEVVTMPKLGFDMAEGTLVRWVVLEGETVSKGAILAEIETDKATVEVESTHEGVVSRHLVNEGDIVPVNTPIAVIGTPDEDIDYQTLLGENGGSQVSGKKEGDTVSVAAETSRDRVEEPVQPDGDAQLPDGVRASPLARKMAQDHGIDLMSVKGSGPSGRITKKDIQVALETPKPERAIDSSREVTIPAMAFTPDARVPTDQVMSVNRLRAAIGRRMVEAKQQVPHFYVTYEYDMAALMALRSETNTLLPEGEKLSVNDFIVRAVALTLREYPNLNASLNNSEIIHHGHVNIGVAVAVEGGLLTVVCHDTDRKSVRQISVELRAKAARARDGKVRPEDIEGSTFSVSNLGMFNVVNFSAIINPPEAAILAVGAVQDIPVVKGDQIVPGLRMKVTISVDHRVSDGAEAAQFMRAMQRYLEEPLRLLV
ncbi:MAG: 2-oxo acid dehydrogenase subunit E2 [Anaerolineales bacterium]|nr:MAG: 2-oxo acid dehydrogenase subunit E2 [Anaerolineales bacterium]